METIACTALRSFTHFVAGYGQVHGDPDNAEAAHPKVPVSAISQLIDENKIEEPDDWVDPNAEEITPPPAPPPPAEAAFTMTHIRFGKYEIKGPGVPPETFVQGKKDAQTMLDLLKEEHAKKAAAEKAEGDGDADGAPIE